MTQRKIIPLHVFGTTLYPGVGAKNRMQIDANAIQAQCQLEIRDPDNGHRHFACYPTWPDALANLKPLAGNIRHVCELIPYGKPCKPYLDVDGTTLPDGMTSVDDLVAYIQDAIIGIFRTDYDHTLHPDDFVWLESPKQTQRGAEGTSVPKISLHLVIDSAISSTQQLVYHSNHAEDPQGAFHMAARLRQAHPLLREFVDPAVYTKDRVMRLLGSSKYEKSHSVLRLRNPDLHLPEHATITWLADPAERTVIKVPAHIPRILKRKAPREIKDPRDMSYRPPEEHLEFVERRMLDLLQASVHPSAYRDRGHGEEDAYDPKGGMRFNYTDRSELCWNGRLHEGVQNMRCWVDTETEDVWVACYSAFCKKTLCLGPLYEDPKLHLAGAVEVNMQYLDPAADPGFARMVDQWANGVYSVLNLRSPMGTGKTFCVANKLR